MNPFYKIILSGLLVGLPLIGSAQTTALLAQMDKTTDALAPKIIGWRRDFHQHPELGNREFETAGKIAAHLKSLGIEVKTGVAKTGVVGILKGGKPGPVVALRADMDALPVVERGSLPFKSTVKTEFNGQQTGVMHACGHDSHMAMLMGAAEVLASVRSDLTGTIKFIFQPAEEGVPAGEEGGAKLMVKEGVLENPKVDAIFGLHIKSEIDINTIKYRSGSLMAAVDQYSITVKGKSTHGADPWLGVDPIVTGSQIVMGLQTIVSRNLPLTENGAVVTVGAFNGGNRYNIIPEEVNMIGTIRSFSPGMQQTIHRRINEIATNIAESGGAKAAVKIDIMYPATINDPALTDQMLPTLQRLAGKDKVLLTPATTIAEDFSFYQEKVPGFFFFLGGKSPDKKSSAPHHTPDFEIDESGFGMGVKALSHLAVEYMEQKTGTGR
ncbi:MAG: amidohydrolase [Bacteroidetes bacterium]|nr:amidohydrolase [Fibrella sp.]